MIIRDDIPLGYTYDSNGNVLTHKNSAGVWFEYIYDIKNRLVASKNSSGNWIEYTRDSNGNVLNYKSSTGYWAEYTYDSYGRTSTIKDSDGLDKTYLCYGKEYTLVYYKNSNKYSAGCQYLKYEKALKFYEEYSHRFEDSHAFIEAIRKHHESLGRDDVKEN